jgi:hypothetical protein
MRSAVNQASAAQAGANASAGMFGNLGSQAYGSLFPFLNHELNAQHTLTPQQEGELMTAAAGGAGGAESSIAGQAARRAAFTHNAAAQTGVEDAAARGKMQSLAKAGENVASQDVQLTERNKQNAARGLAGLYGVDTSAMLRSMGLMPEDINAETRAGQSGWLQNLMGILRAGGQGAAGAGALMGGIGGG